VLLEVVERPMRPTRILELVDMLTVETVVKERYMKLV